MPLAESILNIAGAAIGAASGLKDLQDYLQNRLQIEDVLAKLVREGFQQHLPRLNHLCSAGQPTFDDKVFKEWLRSDSVSVTKPEDLPEALLPALRASVLIPGATCGQSEFDPVFHSILRSASRDMWNRLAKAPTAAREALLKQGQAILEKTETLQVTTDDSLQRIEEKIDKLGEFARRVWKHDYDQLLDTAPPSEHCIDDSTYPNPFLLARAEDFNHNYAKLAKLF